MLIFAQMDSDKVTILRDKNYNNPNLKPDFEIIKEFNVGKMPFDAMIKGEAP